MSNEDDTNKASAHRESSLAESGSGLARPLQEHLAQKLRSAYHELADKPAFLGDPAVPVEFEYHLQRLEAVEKVRHEEKVHNRAVEAVKTALEDIAGSLDSEPSQTTLRPEEK
jgi:hypothetical protein